MVLARVFFPQKRGFLFIPLSLMYQCLERFSMSSYADYDWSVIRVYLGLSGVENYDQIMTVCTKDLWLGTQDGECLPDIEEKDGFIWRFSGLTVQVFIR